MARTPWRRAAWTISVMTSAVVLFQAWVQALVPNAYATGQDPSQVILLLTTLTWWTLVLGLEDRLEARLLPHVATSSTLTGPQETRLRPRPRKL